MSAQHRPWRQSYEAGVPGDVEVPDRSFDALFAEAAAAAPSQPALSFVNRVFSYAELDSLIARVAAALQRDGIGPGERVWIDLPPCAHWWMAVLGTLRAGGVPVLAPEPGAPSPAGVAGVLGPLRASIVARGRAPGVAAAEGVVVAVDPGSVLPRSLRVARAVGRRFGWVVPDRSDGQAGGVAWDVWLGRGSEPRPATRPTTSPALCLTAGAPRPVPAVTFTHRHLVAGATQLRAWLPDAVPAADTWLVLAPLAGGLGAVAALGAAALLQARVVVVPRATFENVRDVVRYLRPAYVVSTGDTVAALTQDPRLAQSDMRGVRVWLTGDPLDPEVASAFHDATGLAPCTGLGGPEVAGLVLCHPANAPVRQGCLGLPLPSVDIRICGGRAPTPAAGPGAARADAAGGGSGRLEVAGPNVAADGWLPMGADVAVDADGFVCLASV